MKELSQDDLLRVDKEDNEVNLSTRFLQILFVKKSLAKTI
jgi:hypothetical protein